MKKVLALVGAVLVLAGCSEPAPKPPQTPSSPGLQLDAWYEVRVIDVKVKERTVTCVFWDTKYGNASVGGLSGDWANAK